jgi:two-component sensor histidine kinase
MFMEILARQTADYIERKQLEETTQQRTEELEALLNVLPIPAWITTDPSCAEVRGNTAASTLFNVRQAANVSQSSAPERGVILQHYVDGRLLAPEELPLQKALATGKTQKVREIEVEDLLGRRFVLSGAAAPLFDTSRRVRGAVAALADITDLKGAKEHNDVLLRELQHRCNNLLSIVQMLVQRTLCDALSGAATLDEAKPKLPGRLRALAHSTRQLTKSDWAGVSLVELVRVTTETFSTRRKHTVTKSFWLERTPKM